MIGLALALNRTLVLPQMWCYCDKFWSRLNGCTISEARSSQPLPFVCPMDHVVELQSCSMLKTAMLVGPQLASTVSSDCI